VVWPDHGEAQGDMATDCPHGVGGKRSFDIDVASERFGMAKGCECKKEAAQVSNQEGHIQDNNKDRSHLHKRLVGGKEACGREIEDCCEEGEHSDGEEGINNNKRARTQEEGNGSSRAPSQPAEHHPNIPHSQLCAEVVAKHSPARVVGNLFFWFFWGLYSSVSVSGRI